MFTDQYLLSVGVGDLISGAVGKAASDTSDAGNKAAD